MAVSIFDDEAFQDQLVALISSDIKSLKDCGHLLTAEDFKPVPGMKEGRPRWILADRALDHWHNHREPAGQLLKSSLIDYANQLNLGENQINELLTYLQKIQKLSRKAPDAVVERVVRFKRERIRAEAIQELVDLQSTGQLTDEQWAEITGRATKTLTGDSDAPVDFFADTQNRIERRRRVQGRYPLTFIDPLDSIITPPRLGEVGLALAPYKRGKSSFLLWLQVAAIAQRFIGAHFTLEDSSDIVNDRLDSIISRVPLKLLQEYPKYITKRAARLQAMSKKLFVYDGRDKQMTVSKIRSKLLQLRDQGEMPNFVTIDYDDKVIPPRRRSERRHEFADIYNEIVALAAELNIIIWTASQTQRNTKGLKIVTGDRLAEDIGKIQKVTCAISLGKGDWSDTAIYLYVAAHKNDIQEVGCEIIPDLNRSIIYDRDKTEASGKQNNAGVPGGTW